MQLCLPVPGPPPPSNSATKLNRHCSAACTRRIHKRQQLVACRCPISQAGQPCSIALLVFPVHHAHSRALVLLTQQPGSVLCMVCTGGKGGAHVSNLAARTRGKRFPELQTFCMCTLAGRPPFQCPRNALRGPQSYKFLEAEARAAAHLEEGHRQGQARWGALGLWPRAVKCPAVMERHITQVHGPCDACVLCWVRASTRVVVPELSCGCTSTCPTHLCL